MDFPVELLYFLFLAVYFVLGALRKSQQRKRQRAPGPAGGDPTTIQAPTPFEEFVRQMEESMREASGLPAQPEPEPIEVGPQDPPLPSPMPVPTRRPVTGLSREPEFRDIGSFAGESVFESERTPAHERHSFGLDRPFSEEAFERLERGRDITEHAHPSLAPLPPARRPSRAENWRDRLTDPKHAQDALVLKEIFSGPWSPRRTGKR